MAWGEAREPRPGVLVAADRLAAAVRAWRDRPTTGNADRLVAAADAYERAVAGR